MSTYREEEAKEFALAALPEGEVTAIKVKFTLITPNGLRKIIFELDKTTEGGVVKWAIQFQLFERAKKADPFELVVELSIEVDTSLNDKAQAIADKKKLTANQSAYLVGPGADKSKDHDKPKARKAVQDTLNK